MNCSLLTLLAVLCLLGGCASKLTLEMDASPVRAKVGDDVVLKCKISVSRPPVDLSQLVVQWFHGLGEVVEFDNVVNEGRPGANLSMEELQSGNAALYLSEVTPESAGTYICFVIYAPYARIKQVTLQVEDPLKPPEEESKAMGPDTCAPHPMVLRNMAQLLNVLEQISLKLDAPGTGAEGKPDPGPDSLGRSDLGAEQATMGLAGRGENME
ncbi:programmed cell death 1 ligand 1-like [Emydura macquarii macquarii]|uniref:programmed cell death 1 ligand 1-like n=1 Tax=Emydura macquarii macquarii TaxID=1129001 RepID=UPI00352BA4D9